MANVSFSNATMVKPTWSFSSTQITSVAVCVASILTSSINVAVFASPSLKDHVYKFLLVSSTVDLVYLVLALPTILLNIMCEASPLLCGSYAQYVQKAYTLWISDFIASSLALYAILNEMFLSLQRLLILRKNMIVKNWKVWHVGPVMMLISLLVYMPIMLVKQVQQIGFVEFNGIKYPSYLTVSVSSLTAVVNGIQAFIRALLVTVGMTVINVATLYNFRLFIKKKSQISASTRSVIGGQKSQTGQESQSRTNGQTSQSKSNRSTREPSSENKANRNITIMLLSTSALYITGTMPYMIFLILRYLSTVRIPFMFISLVYIFLMLLIGLKVFVYYTCNKFYREVLNGYFKAIFRQ